MTASQSPTDARPRALASRDIVAAVAVAWVLVALRGAVFIIFQQSFFDSDQAIVGLMAKHLSEGRAFPLYYYGQTYLLGVDAWLAAVVFLVVGPSVAALHASLLMESLAAAAVLVVALHRADGIRPWMALVTLLPVVFPPPLTASFFMDGAATAAPFLYIALLWVLRRRPIWFGVLLAVGFLHREFTMYAVPALVGLEAIDGSLWRQRRLRHWAIALAAAVAMWQFVQALKPFADIKGPGTHGQAAVYAGSQVDNLSDRVHLLPSEVPDRVSAMVSGHLPRVVGATVVDEPAAAQGHAWLFWPFLGGLAAILARLAWLGVADPAARPSSRSCAAYLLVVGLLAAVGYIVSRSADQAQDRYLLLILFIPVGLVGALIAHEPRPWARGAALALPLLLAGGAAVDHVHLAERYLAGREPDDLRPLVAELERRHVTLARSGYWRAYKITFIAKEKVIVASSDVARIDEYQLRANAAGDRVPTLADKKCEGGDPLPYDWYLCREE